MRLILWSRSADGECLAGINGEDTTLADKSGVSSTSGRVKVAMGV